MNSEILLLRCRSVFPVIKVSLLLMLLTSIHVFAKGAGIPHTLIPAIKVLHPAAAHQVTGLVTDEKDHPLVGVTVRVRGTSEGTVTDTEGKFSLEVPDGAVLEVSYVGYETQEIVTGDKMYFAIQLQTSSSGLNEVVVVGYGTQKKVNLTGAVSQIDSKMLEDRPVANVSQALQGVVPNLSVSFSDGRPGSSGELNIRGFTSINGGEPLVLVDGVPGDIDLINPADVATISVLKDASSAAIYGARAAYGVILVTTKSGQKGKLKITYRGNYSVGTPTTSHDFVTDGYTMARLVDESYQITKGTNYTGYNEDDYAYLKKRQMDPSLPAVVVKNVNGTDRYVWYGSTDWWHHFFRKTKPSMSHSLQFSGGTDKIDFLLSGRYYQQLGMYQINRDKYTAYNLHAKINAHMTPWLTISDNLQFSANKYTYPGPDVNKAFVYLGVHAISPWVPVNPDGTGTYMPSLNGQGIADGYAADLQYGKSKSQTKDFDLTNTVSVTLTPVKNLSIIGSYSYDLHPYSSFNRSTKAPWSNTPGVIGYVGTDYLTEESNLDQYHVINAYATYSKSLGAHSFKVMGGYNQELKKYHQLWGRANNLLSEDLNELALGSDGQQTTSTSVEWALRGFFGRINYDYKDKYLLELDGRYDGSSHFPDDSRYGFFPSVSAGWRVSEEPFFEGLKKVVSELKLRGSYGSLGNQYLSTNLRSQNYPYIPLMNTGQSAWLMGGSKSQYLSVGNPVSPTLTWERTNSVNAGVDIGLLNNRLNVTFDWYDRKTLDMLIPGKTLPSVFGASSPKQNAGDLDTKGFDLSVQWKDRKTVAGKAFFYHVGFVLSDDKSYITRFDNPTELLSDYYAGERIGQIWGYTIDGYFKTDEEAQKYDVDQDKVNAIRLLSPGDGHNLQAGDMKFADLDGNKIIDKGDNTLDNHGDLKVIGNSLPRYSFGITAGAAWNGFDVSVFFQGIGHQDFYPGADNYFFWGPYSRPYHSFFPKGIEKQIWSPDNPNAYFPKLRGFASLLAGTELYEKNDRYLQNAAYIRLKNLSVGYNLSQRLLQKYKIEGIRIYVSGENLWMHTAIKSDYMDPEQVSPDPNGNGGNSTARVYPFFKTYSFGLDITF